MPASLLGFFVMYMFGGYFNFWWFFFVVPKAYEFCRHARTAQLVSQQSLASTINKVPKLLTKRLPVATTVPIRTNTVIGALVYWGIPSDLRSRPEQFYHLPGALLTWWLQVANRVYNGHPHLQLYRKSTYFHYLWLYFQIKAKKVWYLTKSPMAAEFIY